MNLHEQYLNNVKSFVNSLDSVLTSDERAEVEHFINHGECGEAMITLAWIIFNEHKIVSPKVISEIIYLSEGLILKEHLPPDFEHYSQR